MLWTVAQKPVKDECHYHPGPNKQVLLDLENMMCWPGRLRSNTTLTVMQTPVVTHLCSYDLNIASLIVFALAVQLWIIQLLIKPPELNVMMIQHVF